MFVGLAKLHSSRRSHGFRLSAPFQPVWPLRLSFFLMLLGAIGFFKRTARQATGVEPSWGCASGLSGARASFGGDHRCLLAAAAPKRARVWKAAWRLALRARRRPLRAVGSRASTAGARGPPPCGRGREPGLAARGHARGSDYGISTPAHVRNPGRWPRGGSSCIFVSQVPLDVAASIACSRQPL